jgi:NADH pyrophosphatase NudC (nudix superfamily)
VEKTAPKHVIKYCPGCGSSAFTYNDNNNSFLCEECSFNFFINNSAAVACIITDKEGKIMLARRAIEPNKGMLDLPGGFVDPMESAEDAVIREIKEELGVAVTGMQYLTSFPNEYVFSGLTVFTLDMAFLCQIDDLDKIKPQDDISSVIFTHPKNINFEELFSVSMKSIIKYYIENNL